MKGILLIGMLGFISGYAVSQSTANATGVWIVRGFAGEPWTFELKQTGSTLTGTMRQNGEPPGPVAIYEGSVRGDAVSFRGNSPDQSRRIIFAGTLRADEITLTRTTENLGNASPSGLGLFGPRGAPQLTLRRATGLRVTGRVTGARPTPAGGRLIMILGNVGQRGNGPCTELRAEVATDGSFEFINVPPCAYFARAQFSFGDTGRGVFPGTGTPVTVTDKDVTGIVIGPQ